MAERPKSIRPPVVAAKGTFKIVALGRRWLPHHDLYHVVLERSWVEFFVFTALAFLGANAIFALAYLAEPGSISNARAGSFEDAFFFSVQTMATIGYGAMAPATLWGHAMVTLEALLGIFGIAVVTGITFAKFARPTARVLFAEKAVIAPRDGVPHLMFRMANWRHNQVVEAQLRVMVLALRTTREGESFRYPLEIPLVRDRTAVFGLTWTAAHMIDESSPFFGDDAIERLRAAKATEIYLAFTGLDQTISQAIHARHVYKIDDIVPNAIFADVLTTRPDGTREIDYRTFHDVVPLGPSAPVAPTGPPGADVSAP